MSLCAAMKTETMRNDFKFTAKQLLKMFLQSVILPCAYSFWSFYYRKEEPKLIIFADAHHKSLPYSMQRIHAELLSRGYEIVNEIYDFSALPKWRTVWLSVHFMKLYAQARFVFICDAFLPVASCRKQRGTTVVQLLHSCGLFKKMGYDTCEDIPAGYVGHVYKNYDLVTVSAPGCVAPLQNAMRLPDGVVKAFGVSRTDNYFDEAWLENCRTRFYNRYPELREKKIILWAPTFRGYAGDPRQVGLEEIDRLAQQLGDGYQIIKKVHPHVDGRYRLSDCDIPTEELFPVTDLLISDYSSVVNEFMLFGKPYLLFAPDLKEYEERRGFYVPYETLSPYLVTDLDKLCDRTMEALSDQLPDWVAELCSFHLGSCDGHSTERILKYVGLYEVESNV